MPSYAIVLLYDPPTKPGGSGTTDREERQFANLGEALQRAREMYRHRQESDRLTSAYHLDETATLAAVIGMTSANAL
jgi:hypothetical protein